MSPGVKIYIRRRETEKVSFFEIPPTNKFVGFLSREDVKKKFHLILGEQSLRCISIIQKRGNLNENMGWNSPNHMG